MVTAGSCVRQLKMIRLVSNRTTRAFGISPGGRMGLASEPDARVSSTADGGWVGAEGRDVSGVDRAGWMCDGRRIREPLSGARWAGRENLGRNQGGTQTREQTLGLLMTMSACDSYGNHTGSRSLGERTSAVVLDASGRRSGRGLLMLGVTPDGRAADRARGLSRRLDAAGVRRRYGPRRHDETTDLVRRLGGRRTDSGGVGGGGVGGGRAALGGSQPARESAGTRVAAGGMAVTGAIGSANQPRHRGGGGP